jgi:predicted dinucleotide-binding enzyme
MPTAREVLGDGIEYAKSMLDCASGADVLVIATPWAEFRNLLPGHLNGASGRATVIDCWRMLPRELFAAVTRYITLGTGEQPSASMSALVGAAAPGRAKGR